MHVISRRKIREAQQRYPNAASWLDHWWCAADAASWANLHKVRAEFPASDQVGSCLVFNVCGNNYRLICGVTYSNTWTQGTLYVKRFLTHADYDKDSWPIAGGNWP